MTREEAIELLCYGDWLNVISEHIGKQDTERIAKAMCIVGKALRPVSREQVEKVWRGEWLHPHWHNSESCADCSRCNADVGHREFRGVQTEYNFCPVCGAPMTDEAVEMVMERMDKCINLT